MEGEALCCLARRVTWLEGLIKDVKAVGKTPSAETKRLLKQARQELADAQGRS